MGGYLAYTKYKNSGIEWLGEIPEHWTATKIKFGYDTQLGKMLQPQLNSEEDQEVDYLKAVHVQWDSVSHEDLPKMWASPNDRSKYSVKNGDLLICEGGEVGRSAILRGRQGDCLIQNSLHRVRNSDRACVEYLDYLMRHIADSGWFYILCSKATIAHLTSEKLAVITSPLAPLPEQQQIAAFLDYKTAQIDALIAKKEALLEKLAEKRTALISQAVTKGLDPTVEMKDSGIEWLGKIPAHWEMKKTKHLAQILRGKFTHRPRNDPRLYNGDYPFIQTGDVANADTYIQSYSQTLNEDGFKVSKEFPSGTLVMTIAANIGDMAILDFNACFPDSIVGFLPRQNIHLMFLYYMFVSMKQQLLSTAVQNTQLNLNIERIGSQFGTCPPIEEQAEIAKNLEAALHLMNQQYQKVESAIDRLKEYRTALITNAVTGKIDVRDIKLPEPTLSKAA